MIVNLYGEHNTLPKNIIDLCKNAARLFKRRFRTNGVGPVSIMVVEPKDAAPYVEVRSDSHGVVARFEISPKGRLAVAGN